LTDQAIVLDRGQIVRQSSSQSLLDELETLNRLVAVA
jgi:branched-chain amino acid transport system ATP-binding protein